MADGATKPKKGRRHPVQTPLFENVVAGSIRANRDHGFVYLNNPKVGCSTVKGALWARVEGIAPSDIKDVHDLAASPFDDRPENLDWAAGAFVFSFTRNPFARLVSAFLNKIDNPKSDGRAAFYKAHGIEPSRQLRFDEFVEIIESQVPHRMNRHWRPQYINLLHPFVRPNFVADLQDMDAFLPRILARIFDAPAETVDRRARHATGASGKYLSFLSDPATRRRIVGIYGTDFEVYGYHTDPERGVESVHEPRFLDHEHPELVALAGYFAAAPRERAKAMAALARIDEAGHLHDWLLFERMSRRARNDKKLAKFLQRNARRLRRAAPHVRRKAKKLARRLGDDELLRRLG